MVRVAKGSSFALSSSTQPQVKLVELFPVQIEWGGSWLGGFLSQGVVYTEIFDKFKARNYILLKKSLSWKYLKSERALGENKIHACFFIIFSIYLETRYLHQQTFGLIPMAIITFSIFLRVLDKTVWVH